MASFTQNIIDSLFIVWLTVTALYDLIKFKYIDYHSTENEESVDGKVVVITGAQRGIGKAVAKEFAKRGAVVIMGCVDLVEGKKALEEIKNTTSRDDANIVLLHLDLSDMSSVREFALTVQRNYPEIKILLNNAGLGGSPNGNVKTKDGFNLHMAVNHLGHFLLTNLLLPTFNSGSRVVSVSSTLQLLSKLDLNDLMMDNADLEIAFEKSLPYANTKFANALFIKELGRRLNDKGITTYAVCPGVVRTAIYENSSTTLQLITKINAVFNCTLELACVGILYCALDKELGKQRGSMYRFKKQFKAVNDRLDPALARNLWELSSTLVKLDAK